MPISATHLTEDLGLQYSCSFDFQEQAHHQAAVAKRTAAVILWAFRAQNCKLIFYKSHARPYVEHSAITPTPSLAFSLLADVSSMSLAKTSNHCTNHNALLIRSQHYIRWTNALSSHSLILNTFSLYAPFFPYSLIFLISPAVPSRPSLITVALN